MQVKRLLLLIFTFIMIFAFSFTSIPISQGNGHIHAFQPAITQSQNFSGKTDFTIFLSGNTHSLNTVIGELPGLIHAGPGSRLITFSVPSYMFDIVNRTLSSLHASDILNYFYTNSSQPVITGMVYSNVTPYQVSPFAYSPSLISKAYNFTQAYSAGDLGQGVTIAIVDAYGDPNLAYDVNAFDHLNNLPGINLTVEYPMGRPLSVNMQWAIETSTDVEWAHAMAPDARIDLFVSPTGNLIPMMNITSTIISHDMANIISLSWGIPESEQSGQELATYSAMLQQAQYNGISIVASSGDQGAFDGTPLYTVNFPASDPYVLSVGGTSLSFFNNVIIQQAWGGKLNGNTYGSGGGFSSYFSKPSYQDGIHNITNKRGVPDVAMDADNYTGIEVITGGGQYRIGGTSIGAPIWSAVIALLDEHDRVSIGNPDYLFYQIYRTPYYNSSFSQIYSGSNGYYSASQGWNPVTGLGTPLVWQLIQNSEKFLSPYGASLEMVPLNGTFTGVQGNLSLTGNISENVFTNLSDYFYISLYSNSNQYIRTGILLHNGTYRPLMMLNNYGIENLTYGKENIFPGNMTFNLSLNVSEGRVISKISGTEIDTQAFLNFTGDTVPSIGEAVMNSETNMSFLYVGTFHNISAIGLSGPVDVKPGEFFRYSGLNQQYSNISLQDDRGGYKFQHGGATTYNGSNAASVQHIMYTDTFTDPSKVQLSLSSPENGIEWEVNGQVLKNLNSFESSGGNYTVYAIYSGNGTVVSERAFSIPELINVTISVNSTISFDASPSYTVSVDNGAEYTGSGRMEAAALKGYNAINIRSPDFNSSSNNMNSSRVWNFTLLPKPVGLSFFVFQPGSSVSVGNTVLQGNNGTFTMRNAYIHNKTNITVGSPGFHDYTFSIEPVPGSNHSFSVMLVPVNSSLDLVRGYLLDNVFGFGVSGGEIYKSGNLVSFVNSSGYFQFYSSPGTSNITVKSPNYEDYQAVINVSNNMPLLRFDLDPMNVSISSRVILTIERYFPFLFFFGFVSWTEYKGNDFSHYEVFVSGNSHFSNSTSFPINSQGESYTILTGITPLHKSYVILELYLNNSQQYTTEYVSMSYSNPVYFLANLAITAGIAFYVFLMVDYLYLRKRRRKNDDW